MAMLLRQLTYFVKTAELGSISGAAEVLRVSQPAVGIQIKKLEEYLGTPLFSRSHSGVRLTPAGERFVVSARDVLTRLDASVKDLARFGKAEAGDVKLGVTSAPSRVLLTSIVEALSQHHAEINVIIKQGAGRELMNSIEVGELDLAISHMNTKSKWIEAEPVAAQEFYLIGPAALVGTTSQPILFADLRAYPLIQGGSESSIARQEALERLAAARQIKLDFAFGAPINVRRQVMQTLGRCTISFYSMFVQEILAGELFARPIREPTLTQVLHLIRSSRHTPGPVELVTRNVITTQIRDVIDAGTYRWHAPDWQPRETAVEEMVV